VGGGGCVRWRWGPRRLDVRTGLTRMGYTSFWS